MNKAPVLRCHSVAKAPDSPHQDPGQRLSVQCFAALNAKQMCPAEHREMPAMSSVQPDGQEGPGNAEPGSEGPTLPSLESGCASSLRVF
eukprot:gene6249-6071_t